MKHSANDDDVRMGARLRAARIEKKISQADIGERIGISFQQIQKYEKGVNRVSAGRLVELAAAYGKPIEWFAQKPQLGGRATDLGVDMLATDLGRRLCEAFLAIDSQLTRTTIIKLVEAIAASPSLPYQQAAE